MAITLTTFEDLYSITRETDAAYVDGDGDIQVVPADTPRIGHHIWDGAEFTNAGIIIEDESRTNFLLNSDTLSTQNVTVTAEPYTLSFTGSGTISLSGASTDGPLVGIGPGEQNRVSLTFTPTAGTLALSVYGSVKNAQLEQGSTRSSYIPSGSEPTTRSADILKIKAGKLPYSDAAMSFALSRRITYADSGTVEEATLFDWASDSDNRITITLDTSGTKTGTITLTVVNGGSSASISTEAELHPGENSEVRIACRVTSSEINIATDGVAGDAVQNTAGVPSLSSSDAIIGGMIVDAMDLAWGGDLGDDGIAQASNRTPDHELLITSSDLRFILNDNTFLMVKK